MSSEGRRSACLQSLLREVELSPTAGKTDQKHMENSWETHEKQMENP